MSEPKNKYMRELVTNPEQSTEELLEAVKEYDPDYYQNEEDGLNGVILLHRLSDCVKQQQDEIERLKKIEHDKNEELGGLANEAIDLKAKLTIATDAIKASLRIEMLWIPSTADEEHRGEADALHKMRQGFIDALQQIEKGQK